MPIGCTPDVVDVIGAGAKDGVPLAFGGVGAAAVDEAEGAAGRGPGAGSLAGGVPPASVSVPRPEACAGAGVGRAGSVRRCTGAETDRVNGAEAGAVAGPGLAGDTRMPRVGKAPGAGAAGVADRAVTTGTAGAAAATGA
ncbi:hypothetical protein ACWCPF_27095 [Streptomyces sp. NPDC001858]